MTSRSFRLPALLVVCGALAGGTSLAQGGRPSGTGSSLPGAGSQQPTRDTPAQKGITTPSGRISGRVLAADTGRPVKRARVLVTAPELGDGRATVTDETGAFEVNELPAGRYTVAVSKTGFIALTYGQRRPMQAGVTLQLGDKQQMSGVDFRLPRGSVISGRVFDDDGDPLPGATVRVMRYQFVQGQRRLVPAGTAQTDDRGQYRVWGLTPGDYYVSGTANAFAGGGRMGAMAGGGPFGGGGGGFGPGGGGGGRGPGNNLRVDDGPEQVNFAPTYYPGVTSAAEAGRLVVSMSQEALDIDFGLQLVRTSRVSGRATNADGTAASSGNVALIPDGARGQIGGNFGTRIRNDGAFTINNVPPGRYTLRARGDDADFPQYASQPLSLNGQDVPNVALNLVNGIRISGSVTFEASAQAPPDPAQIRIMAASADLAQLGRNPETRVEADGKFYLDGVPAGSQQFRVTGFGRNWMLKAILLDGRDVTDLPIEVRGNQAIGGVQVVLTDRLTELSGMVLASNGKPVLEYMVVAFPVDTALWQPQARQIAAVRPDQTGHFQIRGLPPGEYYLAPADPAEQGQWYDPVFLEALSRGAVRIAIAEGDLKAQDLTVGTPGG